MAARLPSPARVATGAAALALALAFAVASAGRAGDAQNVLESLGLGACGVLALGLLLPSAAGLALALTGLGVEYVGAAVAAGAPPDAWAPLAAVALFAVAEMAYWSARSRWRTRSTPDIALTRAAPIALVALAALALASVVTLVAALPIAGGAALTAAGVAAVAALLALIAALAQRGRAA